MRYKLSWVVLLLSVCSCTKVVDLKVNDAKQQYVIEGNITNGPGPYTVTLSRTAKFNASYQFQGVSGAAVLVSDSRGGSETLQETAPGIYRTSTLAGVEGHTYVLDIRTDDQHFTASSTMPYRVNLDSLYIRQLVNVSKTVKAVVPVFTDPKGQGNSYRFNQYINGVLDQSGYSQNDDFTDGLANSFALLQSDPDSTLRPFDHVEIDMQCIDKAVYKYWDSFDQSASGDYSSIPSNPVTNISGGALGYFSAHTSQRRSIDVK